MVEPGILEKVLLNTPEQMVKFKVYKRDERDDEADMIDRRLTRIKNQNKLPLGVWAKMVVESILQITLDYYKENNEYFHCHNVILEPLQFILLPSAIARSIYCIGGNFCMVLIFVYFIGVFCIQK